MKKVLKADSKELEKIKFEEKERQAIRDEVERKKELISKLYENCPLSLRIKYSDGEQGCLTDLPLSKSVDKSWGKPVSDVVRSASYFAIAASDVCEEVRVGVANSSDRNFKETAERNAIGSCSKNCNCAVIISNGSVNLPKKLAAFIGSGSTYLADKPKSDESQKIYPAEREKVKQKPFQIAKEEELEMQRIADLQRKRELDMQAQKQRVLDITLQREIEAQKYAETQKIIVLKVRQKAEAESNERDRLLALAADVEKKKSEEAEMQRIKTEAESKERVKQFALAAELEKQKALNAQQEVDKVVRIANAEQAERQKDRELLLQLSAELSRLRAESEALKKSQTDGRSQVVTLPVKPQSAPATPVVFANRKALVIGNDGYKFVSKLFNAKQDATSIAENLTMVGYNVTLKVDQSEKEMKAALRGFKSQVEAGDEVAIFYAGHGVQIANANYLLPIDVAGEGEEQIKDEAISLQRLLDDMSDKKVKFTLAMIDACRDNPFKGSGRSIGGGARGLTPTTAATGQMVVFSAGTGQQALDKLGPNDKDKNGLFTRVFIKEMQKSGVTIDQLVRSVRNEVVTTAKSIGHDQVPAIYDQVVGEFYFRK